MKNKSNQTKNSPFLNTNSSRYLSTMNNKSLSTNESATAFTSGLYKKNRAKLQNYYTKYPGLNIKEDNENNDKNYSNNLMIDFYSTAQVNSERKLIFDDADQIMKERIRRMGGAGPLRQTRTSVLDKTKEICLNNYLITQLREKRKILIITNYLLILL